jgi:hypothetical protein
MVTTKHCYARMSQRGLPKRLIELVLEFGKDSGDKLILNKKATQKVINEIDMMRKELLRIIDKGGVTVVVDNDTLITAYNTNSYKRN